MSQPTQEMINLIKLFSVEFEVPYKIIYNLINTESSFNPNAFGSSGELGLMQILPSTSLDLHKYRVDLYDIEMNIYTGTMYLKTLFNIMKDVIDIKDRWMFSVASYNAGIGNIIKLRKYLLLNNLSNQEWNIASEYLDKITGNSSSITKKYVDKIFIDITKNDLVSFIPISFISNESNLTEEEIKNEQELLKDTVLSVQNDIVNKIDQEIEDAKKLLDIQDILKILNERKNSNINIDNTKVNIKKGIIILGLFIMSIIVIELIGEEDNNG